MVSPMKLRGKITLEQDRSLTFHGEVFDGTPFTCRVSPHDVQMNEEFLPSRLSITGFLFVDQEGKSGGICYLTLPKPSETFGRQISVKDHQLMPREVKLADFGPKNKTSAE
jgi:hypothetical protein